MGNLSLMVNGMAKAAYHDHCEDLVSDKYNWAKGCFVGIYVFDYRATGVDEYKMYLQFLLVLKTQIHHMAT